MNTRDTTMSGTADAGPAPRAPAWVRAIAPYVPGKPIEELARELHLDPATIVKLASNENPRGASPKALAAIREAAHDLTRYPDGSGFALRSALSQFHGVGPERIVLGNGSNDVLEMVAAAFLTPGDEAVYAQYAFAVYPLATRARGATGVEVPARDYGHDLGAMRAAITPRTRVVFVANPNNPTGTWVSAAALEAFIAKVPASALVVLDEAYFEYAGDAGCGDGLAWLERYPNLVVVRTFSKAYGLAALRVGFAASHREVADVLNRIRQPFNVNSLALEGARAALADREHVARSVALVAVERPRLARGLAARGFAVLPSAGNFVLADCGDAARAAKLHAFLLRQGVIVRPVGNYGLAQYLRITVGLEAENTRLLGAIDAWLAGGAH